MLTIVEILLTVAAWRKGWKWLALIPLLAAVVTGFFSGFMLAALGYDFRAAAPYFMLIDIAAIIALIFLAVMNREEKTPAFKQMLSQPPHDQQPMNVRRAISSYGDEQL